LLRPLKQGYANFEGKIFVRGHTKVAGGLSSFHHAQSDEQIDQG
jgi:hypothetical protein